jgi:hypothetical protein
MRKLIPLFLGWLWGASPLLAAPTVTVSATAQTLLGTNQIISLRVDLVDPNNTGLLRVNGTQIVPIMTASTVTPGVTATVGPIYGNDVIRDAFGNLNSTYYRVRVFTVPGLAPANIISSTAAFQQFFAFTGAGTVDLATATPLAPSFMTGTNGSVVIPGSLTVSGTGTFSGTNTFSGSNTFSGPLVNTGTDSGNQTISGNKTFSGTDALSGPLVITGTDTGTQTISGNKTLTGTNTHNGPETFGRINAVRTAYVGNVFDTAGSCAGEMGCIINNAIKDIPDAAPEGIIIYAFGGGTISTNPWASIGNRSGIIYFGSQIFTTNISLQVPTAWKVEGYGRGAIADGKNTIIKAGASFPTSTPVMQMGLTPGPADGVQIRNLGIDCQNIAGVSGIQNQFSQEESLVEHVLFVNCPGGALSVSTSAAQNSGPYADLEVLNFSCSNCAAGTVPVSIGAVGSFRGIRGITINSNGSTLPTIALRIDAAGTYSDIHIESAVSSVVIGSVAGTSSVVMTNVECGPSITDCVKISNAFGTQNITLLGITSTTGNIITDQILSNTLTQAGEGGSVAAYITGNGSPPTLFTSSANFPKIVHLINSGTAAMTTAAIASVNCGTVVTVAATGVATTDSITWSFGGSPGSGVLQLLTLSQWPTAGNVNFQYCNPTANSITPGSATLNWRVVR